MALVDHNSDKSMLRDGYYNVTWAVGPVGTAPNRRDDVLLVQYLLKKIAENPARRIFAIDWTLPSPAKSFLVDGWMGSVTAAWIRSYQKAVNKNVSGLIRVDNRIDRARGDITSISHTTYTIQA